ncbi:MAG: glycosyltransferase [Candidatus Woesearchaeota archaeon]
MIKQGGVSLFLPVYNEEKIIKENVLKLYHLFKENEPLFEIVIVDDNSKDKTGELSKELASAYSEIRYLHFDNGPSRRENLAEAFKQANYPIVSFCDVDLATDPQHFPKLINAIREGNDISSGSRYMGIPPAREKKRLIISKLYNFSLRTYFGSKMRDHQCGFKAYNKERLMPLITEAGYDSRFKRGWFWDAEILIRAQKKKYTIYEFPVNWNCGKQSSFNLKRELRMLGYVLKLKWRL